MSDVTPYPKWVFAKNAKGEVEEKMVANPEALDQLTAASGLKWFESPPEAMKGQANPGPAPAVDEEKEALHKQVEELQAALIEASASGGKSKGK